MNLSHKLTVEDACDSLKSMRLQEETGYHIDTDLYQTDSQILNTFQENGPLHVPVDAQCRFKMANWCFQLVDFCKFNRETVAIAMSYLVRYLMNPHWGVLARQDRHVYQLVAMTCLYTAVKIHEPEAMTPKTISALSCGAHDTAQVEEMERSILMALEWRMNPPTPQAFVHQFMELVEAEIGGSKSINQTKGVLELAKFQAELATNDPSLVGLKPSSIAFASMANATDSVELLGRIAHDGEIDLHEASIAQKKLCMLMSNSERCRKSKCIGIPMMSLSSPHSSQLHEQVATEKGPSQQYKTKIPFPSPQRSPRCVTTTAD